MVHIIRKPNSQSNSRTEKSPDARNMSPPSQNTFFDYVSTDGLPTTEAKSQPWKTFFAGPQESLAKDGAVIVEVPSEEGNGE